jgi:DNA polymerase III delta prime subunit
MNKMDTIDLFEVLNRQSYSAQFQNLMQDFENNAKNSLYKKGIYIYGPPGCGKTQFVSEMLSELKYNAIYYSVSDTRNTAIMDSIINNGIPTNNIIGKLMGTPRKNVIVMDEIDAIMIGDKNVVADLIKLVRPKKTKKQKLEPTTTIPIIFIGDTHIDKKLKDLHKVCNTIQLNAPTVAQMGIIVYKLMPGLNNADADKIVDFVHGDLGILKNLHNIYKVSPELLISKNFDELFHHKIRNADTKTVVRHLMCKKYDISNHLSTINETDRTTIALIWHENIISILEKKSSDIAIPFYIEQLSNICFADYIDRITFQNQIWQFTEMSSLIKTFKNNNHYHDTFPEQARPILKSDVVLTDNIQFTKVLTKYATEYNNIGFIQQLCSQLNMDKPDVLLFFASLRDNPDNKDIHLELEELYDIKDLDIVRINNYLDKLGYTARVN